VQCKETADNDGKVWTIARLPGKNTYLTPDPNGSRYIRLKGCGMWLQSNQVPFPGITFNALPECSSRQKSPTEFIRIVSDEIRGVGL
jgi:hypothetical protein